VPREGGRHIHWPAWSHDGKYIYFIYTYDSWHAEPAETWRVPAEGGQPEPVVRSVRRAIYPVPLPGGDLLLSGNPNSLDLGLWWQRNPGSDPVALTNGFGEHVESRASADGKRIVSTLLDVRQSLMSIPVNGDKPELKALTDGHSGDLFPSVDIRTGRIVFSSSRSGHRNLWIMDADGSHVSPLTSEAAIDENPSVSPDGQQIAFVSDRGNERAIWLMSVLGGAPRRLAREIVLDTLTWSQDSQRLYFSKPGGDFPSMASVNVNDGHVESIGAPGRTAPAASPTTDVLAYLEVLMVPAPPPATGTVARSYLKFVDGHGTDLYPNLPRQVFVNALTAWSPDGKRLAVKSIPANGPVEIWIVDPQAAQPFQKLLDLPPDTRPRGISWTKDGQRLIIANQQYSGDIVMYDVK
jgi:Tol biopolymer transport system component